MKVECIALKEFYYDKRMVPVNGDCEIEDKDIEILLQAKAIQRKPEGKTSKRHYKRRDMTAENP